MTKLTVTMIDNRPAVFLPSEALARLNIEGGDQITLVDSPNGIELIADPTIARKLELARGIAQDDENALAVLATENVMTRRRDVLKRLAD